MGTHAKLIITDPYNHFNLFKNQENVKMLTEKSLSLLVTCGVFLDEMF